MKLYFQQMEACGYHPPHLVGRVCDFAVLAKNSLGCDLSEEYVLTVSDIVH